MFSNAVCLVLDKRVEDWPLLYKEGLKCNLLIEPFFVGDGKTIPRLMYNHIDIEPPPRPQDSYPAFRDRPNSYNAFLSFKKIVTQAKLDKLEWLLLLEDDAVFMDNYNEIKDLAFKQLWDHDPDWKMFYLGANHKFARTEKVSPNLLKVNGSGCFHAVILRKTVFDEILELPLTNPIDGQAAKLIHPKGHCYSCTPNIVRTKAGFSHCEGRKVNYDEFLLN